MSKMITINNIKIRPVKTDEELNHQLENAIKKTLRIKDNGRVTYKIIKRSVDSRHKPDCYYVFSVGVMTIEENGHPVNLSKKCGNNPITESISYKFPGNNDKSLGFRLRESDRPVIIGFGPAGIFAALKLSEAGLCPVIYERGESIDDRCRNVDSFWDNLTLNTQSNVQFGEGGAGTFSDGKLNTMIKDNTGRIKNVLETFVKFGADPEILYVNKPHIGTDVLKTVVKNIREYIVSLGGEIHFGSCMEKLIISDNTINGVLIKNVHTNQVTERLCNRVILSIGHSARDTFEYLYSLNIAMEPKSFAVGLRLEHPQRMINVNAYGDDSLVTSHMMPVADYKVTWKSHITGVERGVYSFCMCPGGFVVNASSEEGHLCVNGMSYSKRDSSNSNSAMIVTVTPQDFGNGVLSGMEFQRKLEKAAFDECNGAVPVQLFSDFENNRISEGFGKVTPCIKGQFQFGNLRRVLPKFVSDALVEGVHGCANMIKDFDMEDAVFSGVESRTSSPLRIIRGDNSESLSLKGLYPCGEGAGYAGGITSASVDGIKTAEKVYESICETYL
ncbi:MAG: NAD(P)/FAD-dependent oxidoreductase [Lachnospira sp.]